MEKYYEVITMSPAQIRMARAALKIGVRDLAAMADVTTATITRFENERGGLNTTTLVKLRAALEAAGIIFIDADGNGPGVRLRDRQST
jgi:predicted transcriptional regulator